MVTHKKSAAKVTTKKNIAGKPTSKKPHIARKEKELSAVITIDRRMHRDRRSQPEESKTESSTVVAEKRVLERRAKVNRRRQIDPTTCERDYTPDEIEFMAAIDEYKRQSGRMFPTCSEVLEVLRKLGYEKRPKVEIPHANVTPLSAPVEPVAPGVSVDMSFSTIPDPMTIG